MTPQRPRPPAPRPAPPRAAPRRGAPATPAAGARRAGPATGPVGGAPADDAATSGTPVPGRTGAQPATGRRSGTTPGARTTPAPRSGGTPAVRTGGTPAVRTGGTPAVRTGGTPAVRTGGTPAVRTGAFPVRPPVVSQGSAARFAERARARRRLAWRQIVLVAGGVVVAAALAWLLLLSPVLALDTEQVRVTGAGTVVAVDQVRAVVDEEEGTPLPRLDTAALRTALLDVPGVRDVAVTRDWPRGLTVALVSREPVAAVPEAADVAASAADPQDPAQDPAAGPAEDGADAEEPAGPGYALVDQDGVKVGRTDAAPEGLPVVDVPVGEARILAAALGVLEQLPDGLLAEIGQVSAGTQDTVRFVLRDGATVEWGSAQEPALKAAVLQALRAAPETAGAARYDVSAPTMPVVG